MALRIIEVKIPEEEKEKITELLEDDAIIESWTDQVMDKYILVRILLQAEDTESLLDKLEKKFSFTEKFRAILFPVEATIPKIVLAKPEEAEVVEIEEKTEAKQTPLRISRQELYSQISDGTKLTNIFIAMVVLSSIVAAIGLVKDNVAVVIGAMVIAPLLGPNVALALATTLGDFDLGKRALKANITGVAIALLSAVVLGILLQVDLTSGELKSRTFVGLSDIALAIASGAAGALAFSSGVSASLIGVMVAVALLPPLMAFGLLLGSGYYSESFGAFLLLVTNLICINLAGVVTFIVQGIRPRRWWEAKKAKKASRYAIIIWTILLILLAAVIIVSQENLF
ncbi:MAG: TIGR00341 family protein [Ignavibacteriae bacterium]|jgi:uncharacterized hydrophobic protein (TIGR00341 family)|nr:TIGR00341 family protein [Ignavibacteriota bacterium]NOG99366.1 TIGR00341 family protein [Ignavibacteriota bacterium]